MTEPPFIPATEPELRSILTRAMEGIREVLDHDVLEYDPERTARDNATREVSIEALRFAVVAAGHLGAVSLFPLVVEAIELLPQVAERAESHEATLAWGLRLLLRKGPQLDAAAKGLAAHRDARFRRALAAGLRPRGEAEIALLEALSEDTDAAVRSAAAASLAAVREVPWWKGKFERDPVARLSPDEAERVKPALEELSRLLDRPGGARRDDELLPLVSKLPDPLAVEAAERVLAERDPYSAGLNALAAFMLERPSGVDAFARLCARWNATDAAFIMGKSLAALLVPLGDARRAAMCLDFARRAAAAPAEERRMQRGSAARLLAEVAGFGYPEGADLRPLLDLVLQIEPDADPEDLDYVALGLSHAFGAEGADPEPILERVLAARLAGYPGPWTALGQTMDKLLARAPGPLLRAAAEQALRSDDDATATWGLEQILGRAHDPSRDPPAPELAARLFEEPALRPRFLASTWLGVLVAPQLRTELRAGTLDYDAAVTAIRVLGDLHGGVAPLGLRRARRTDEEEEEAERAAREEAGAFLGPRELEGPLTAEEWRRFREARDRREALRPEQRHELLRQMPRGPWEPEDRALLERCLDAIRGGDVDGCGEVALAIVARPAAELSPVFRLLLARADEDAKPLVRLCRDRAAERLGLPAGGEEGDDEDDDEDDGGSEDDAPREWMDEPDDV